MTKIKLKFIHEIKGRDGKIRRYFRRRGHDRIPLPGLPGSPGFNRAYEAALAGQPLQVEIGSSRSKPGTIDSAVSIYLSSVDFNDLASATKQNRLGVLSKFREEHGDKSLAKLQREHILRMMAARPSRSASLHFLLTLQALMSFAVSTGLRKDNPSLGIKRPESKTDGYTWTEEDIEQFEATHPVGTRARLALALGLYTGQRRGDAINLGFQNIRAGAIRITQQKTKTPLTIPIHPALMAILNTTPKTQLLFLQTQRGGRFTPGSFSHWFKDVCREAGITEEATFHGLRRAAARRLAEAGCTPHQIAAITGHKTLKEVVRYTKAADQVKLARQAINSIGEQTGDEEV